MCASLVIWYARYDAIYFSIMFSHPNFLRLKSITLAPARVILFNASTLNFLSHFIT